MGHSQILMIDADSFDNAAKTRFKRARPANEELDVEEKKRKTKKTNTNDDGVL